MRPTIDEQLHALRRILSDVVAPEVVAKYPSDILQGVIANLAELETNWSRWVGYLAWDNAQMALLLDATRPKASATVATQIADAFVLAPQDPYDYAAMCAHNEALRAAVASVIRDARTDGALAGDLQQIQRHLAEGIRRRI
jgi:hypothetical protein